MTADTSEALNRFLAGAEKRAYRMALLSTSNEDDALDIVQDAMYSFVRSYRNKPENEWYPLFQRTLQSRITDWHRRSSVRERFRTWLGGGERDEGDTDPIQLVPDTNSFDPAQEMMHRALGEAIEKALSALPLRQRQAFILRAWEGFDTAETAFAMGCSEGSVKTHYSRAGEALRKLLAEYKP